VTDPPDFDPSPTDQGPAPGSGREAVRAAPRQPGRRGPLPGTSDLYERDEYAATLLASLMHAQLGVTLGVLLPALAVVALYPLLCVLFPAVAAATVGPLPLSLIILGGGIYPPLVVLGFWYVRRAERVEQRFVRLLEDR
jgi:Flp pilus assembly protein TadB